MRVNQDWEPYFAIARKGLPFRERLREYAAVARAQLDTERFEEFCGTHLAHLDEAAWEFFGTPRAREAVRLKVAALFPEHEVEPFTQLFWSRIQTWREEVSVPVRTGGRAS